MVKYYIDNGILRLARFQVTYTVTKNENNRTIQTFTDVLCNTEIEKDNLIQSLNSRGIAYTVEEFDLSGYEKFDGALVGTTKEAEELLNPSLETLVENKLKEISEACKYAIYNGIDVTFSDGTTKHFSLTIEDQMNLNSLFAQINMGVIDTTNGIAYHADGEICTMFTLEDFTLISNTASAFKVRETTYCNHLMAYVKSLTTKEEIINVVYGQELTGEFLESYISIIEALTNENK